MTYTTSVMNYQLSVAATQTNHLTESMSYPD